MADGLKPLMLALAAATVSVTFVRLIELAIPTGRFRDPVILWAIIFGLFMLQSVIAWWPHSRVAASAMGVVAIGIIALELHYGRDLFIAMGIFQPILVPPVAP